MAALRGCPILLYAQDLLGLNITLVTGSYYKLFTLLFRIKISQ